MEQDRKSGTPAWVMRVWLGLFFSMFGAVAISVASSAVGWTVGTYAFVWLFIAFPALFMYSIVTMILSLTVWRKPSSATSSSSSELKKKKKKIPVTPPSPSVNTSLADMVSSSPELQARVERAQQAGNYQAPRARKYSGLVFAMFGVMGAGMLLIFLTTDVYPILTWTGVAMFVLPLGFLVLRQLRPNRQLAKYAKTYAQVDAPDPAAAGNSESWRGRPSFAGSSPAMWGEAMWDKYGKALTGRRKEMERFARTVGGTHTPVYTQDADDAVIDPHLRTERGSGLWQVRNMVLVPDKEDGAYPVQVADVNSLAEVKVNNQPRPNLFISTFAETWFPSDHRMIVFPDKSRSLGDGTHFGKQITPLEPHLDKLYDVYAPEDMWARLVLNVNVMERLVNLYPVVMVIDRGKITLVRPNAWVEPEELTQFTDTVRRIAYSARSAEA